jgi:hypothetical protein
MTKLSKVPVIEVTENVRVPVFNAGDENYRGQKTWRTEQRVTKLYDFGPDNKGHEDHVQMRLSEFTCAKHDQFAPRCADCVVAAEGTPPDRQGPLKHLLKSRGIEVEAS